MSLDASSNDLAAIDEPVARLVSNSAPAMAPATPHGAHLVIPRPARTEPTRLMPSVVAAGLIVLGTLPLSYYAFLALGGNTERMWEYDMWAQYLGVVCVLRLVAGMWMFDCAPCARTLAVLASVASLAFDLSILLRYADVTNLTVVTTAILPAAYEVMCLTLLWYAKPRVTK